eukprot:7377986-Prymnesium_polylepis.1
MSNQPLVAQYCPDVTRLLVDTGRVPTSHTLPSRPVGIKPKIAHGGCPAGLAALCPPQHPVLSSIPNTAVATRL